MIETGRARRGASLAKPGVECVGGLFCLCSRSLLLLPMLSVCQAKPGVECSPDLPRGSRRVSECESECESAPISPRRVGGGGGGGGGGGYMRESTHKPVCVECLIGKQKKPILFKVTEPSSVPYRAPSACAKMAAYSDPPSVILVPESIAVQAAYQLRYMSRSEITRTS